MHTAAASSSMQLPASILLLQTIAMIHHAASATLTAKIHKVLPLDFPDHLVWGCRKSAD
jgi:hypothetical protein